MSKLKRMKDIFSTPKWTLVQSISVYMDPSPANLDPDDIAMLGPFVDQVTSVVYILERCKSITSLALYYRHANVQMMRIRDVLFSLLRKGRLSALGLYSCRLLLDEAGRDESTGEVTGLVELLESVALFEPAQQSLRVLDVVADWVPTRIFDLIRSNFTGLVSLTLRRVVREPWFASRIWDVDQQPKWRLYQNLTRLELNDFEPGYPAHIPFLVQHFIKLKELKISACGKAFSGTTNWRPSGWSQREDALCNTHRTLITLHIEHMEDWEIYELGVIPTATLIVTTVKWSRLLELFRRDDETFPGLQVLRLAPQTVPPIIVMNTAADDAASMQAVCNSRSVQLRFDAPVTQFPCICNWHQGY
jgi:hypothetical protein